ncbi:MAG: type 4a pilus biogenesis protein PilO [Actinomycetota bacterium]
MRRGGAIIAAIVMAGLAVGTFVLLVLPKVREVDRAERDLDAAVAEEVALQVQLAELEEARAQAAQIRRQLARIRELVPPVADLPQLINLLQDAADESEVDFFSVSPGTPVPVPGAIGAEIPAQVQVIGGFFSVDRFLFEIESFDRAAKVTTIEVAEGPDGLPQLQVTMEVQFFTTDTSAGPGSPIEAPLPGPSPSPEESPSPGSTPSPSPES